MSSRVDPYGLVGSTFLERYSIGAFVGFGRFSALYRGTEVDSLRPVAIRLLNVRSSLPPSQRPVILQRLRGFFPSGRELPSVQDVTKVCSTLAGTLDVGSVVTGDGRWIPGVVQSSAAGETLLFALSQERCQDPPTTTLARAIASLSPLADALTYAHASGQVHGGLAPLSVMVRRGTVVHLLDLGVSAALTAIQARDRAFAPQALVPPLFFDPGYASPEHFVAARSPEQGHVLSPASDVFSLALLLLELLTGRAPLGDGDDIRLEAAALDPNVRPTPRARGRDLGGYVEAVFERALAVRAEDRHGTVESFWSAMRAASRLTLRPSRPAVPPALPESVPPASIPPASRATTTTSAPPLTGSPTTPTLAEAFVARAPRRTIPPAASPARDLGFSLEPTLPASSAPGRTQHAEDPVSFTPPGMVRERMTTQDEATDDLVLGETIAGKYSIERVLGRGGMGTVWQCTHLGLGERVAVKVMSRKMADNEEIRARFEREARAAAKIKSRYVARVYDTGTLPDKRPYIVMEYMEGETLADAMKGNQALPLADAVRILGQVGRGLARAHELGIVHRDIKPENVFLAHTSDDGVIAKVFDFGIVKVSDAMNDGSTRVGVVIGTPHYMSPEQADGLAIDARSDIFSLGVLAFRILTGKRLFQGDSILQILMRICSAPLPSLSDHVPALPPAVDAWFQRACARKREDRFDTVIECVESLARAAGVDVSRDVSILPPPPSTLSPARGAVEARVEPGSVPPELVSCPTLIDEGDEEVDRDSEEAIFELTEPANGRARRASNPRFEVAAQAAPRTQSSTAPRRAPAEPRRLRRFLALGGFLVLGVGCIVALADSFAPKASVEETTAVRVVAAPPPVVLPVEPSETVGTSRQASAIAPTSVSGVPTSAPAASTDPVSPADAGLAAPSHVVPPAPALRNGRTRRALAPLH